ncbi:IclR family transcriptional regulator [Effusibacillus lacus]|uniref:Glycerol operon regulatory protein n=1 Tax=Effusibacillus lacus TaxID=1348429 RepID=A0A292YES8_9BACL|nr:IclR family transcriptional regulator [Effusibacillus lacus]TCS73553.1 IclR family transcriptional regulator [Effusibacillus lacus]GAX91952.1 IclR family transcriptional regulator [Effusibacillus lacus]
MERDKGTVRAVERALDILLCFSGTEMELGLSDIAKKVGLHKSTVHRLLASLESKGFIRRHPQTEKYRLGWSVLELVSNVYQSDDLASIVVPEMTHLRDEVGETISLYIRAGKERIRTQAVESNQPVRRVANIGQRFPLYIGASGKVLLAWADPLFVQEVMNDPNWPKELSKSDFKNKLAQTRENGYAISIEEREAGAAALAVPIFGRDNQIVAALSISGPVDRFTPEAVKRFIPAAQKTATLIGKMLTR